MDNVGCMGGGGDGVPHFSRSPHPNSVGRCGFTLVELLVVIGILAMLLAILLPVLSRARQEANAAKCMSNLHQIALGMVMYTEQNHGWIIPAYNLPRMPGASSTSPNFTAGPSHVLPTGGSGRFGSGLRVADFMRRTSLVRYGPASLRRAAPVVAAFAAMERLDAHGRSVELRLRR